MAWVREASFAWVAGGWEGEEEEEEEEGKMGSSSRRIPTSPTCCVGMEVVSLFTQREREDEELEARRTFLNMSFLCAMSSP